MHHLKIRHFKCFEDIDIWLNRCTVLAGANGYGKSTAIQALLYLRRTIEHCGEWIDNYYVINKINGLNVPLNGVYCLSLGNSSFVLNRNYNGNSLSLGLFNETGELTIDYEADNREAKLWLTPINIHKSGITNFPIFKQQFYYLNAERFGPRISQPMQFFDYPNAGWQGEYTAQLMALENGYYRIEDERRFPETESSYLMDQINYWLDFIMNGVKVRVDSNPSTLTAQILIENSYTVSDPTIATNLGFGISYILPIITTGLIAKKDTYFIIENPEAHLHPSAQSKIGRFLAAVANNGVNVVIETHSDHIVNGIQIAIAEKEIDNELTTINFFSQKENQNQPNVTQISITQKGELSEWPKGFFDQTQVDYAYLFNSRKK